MTDLVSTCCQAGFRMWKHEGGSSPLCKGCGKTCNVSLPLAVIEEAPALNFSEENDPQ
jgi:hypothetical protein